MELTFLQPMIDTRILNTLEPYTETPDPSWFMSIEFIIFEGNEQWWNKTKQTQKMKENFIEIYPG